MRKEHVNFASSEAGEGRKTKPMIDVLLSLQETEPETYNDEIIRGLMLVRFILHLFLINPVIGTTVKSPYYSYQVR